MYCARCGKQVDTSLNYCNSCGTQIKKEKDGGKSVLSSLLSALISVAVVGLMVLVGLMVILLDKVPNPEPVFLFGIIYLAVLFGICFMIMRQVSRVIGRQFDEPATRQNTITADFVPPVQLPPQSTNPLEGFREPGSVTDHTTRTLVEVPVRRDQSRDP
ncbi:MAG: hypothetical protein QUS14_08890 [Pyrinomonadaceae bacterium]|nr:hypothetical protein [Pyrinomonadaceae bacterium]